MFNRLLNSQAVLRVAQSVLGAYLAFALRSTRWQIEGGTHLEPFRAEVPVIIAFWHECLPLMPAGWAELRSRNPERRAAALISRHRDGRFIAAIMTRFSVATVHGSSAKPGGGSTSGQSKGGRDKGGRDKGGRDKGGAAALRAMLARLAAGNAVIVTPDGPRGPARVAAPGTIQLAALSGAPILPSAARLRRQLRLGTWDRMILPLPFGRGAIVCAPPIRVARHDDRQAAGARLTIALTEAAERAETLCAQTPGASSGAHPCTA
jgi:lysophospholipid acyltransferase (LPLAT)-like uncharacterized protein